MGHYLSFFRASLRLWRRHFIGVFIAFMGLAAAFAVATLTAFYVYDGVRSDAWIPGVETLYRFNEQILVNGQQAAFGRTTLVHPELAAFARDNVPEVTGVARLYQDDEHPQSVVIGDKSFKTSVIFAEPSFADLVPLPTVEGNFATVLADPSSVALSEADAARFFKDNPIGQTLEIRFGNEVKSYKVGAVFKDIPPNSHLALGVIAGWDEAFVGKLAGETQAWGRMLCYVRLKPGTYTPAYAEALGKRLSAFVPAFARFTFSVGIEPVLGAQYRSETYSSMKPQTNAVMLKILMIISSVLLLVASFNAANLMSAINMGRLREVAIRRISGAGRGHLVGTMLCETAVASLFAYGFGLLLASDLEPVIRNFVRGDIPVLVGARLPLLALGALGAIAIGAVGAAVLAYHALKVRPQDMLRASGTSMVSARGLVRQALVALQAVAVVMALVAAAQIGWQVRHLITKDHGFKTEGLVFLGAPEQAKRSLFVGSFLEAVKALPGVREASATGDTPYDNHGIMVTNLQGPGMPEAIQVSVRIVGPDYMKLLGIRPRAEISEDWHERKNMVGLTAKAMKAFGFKTPEAALGQTLVYRYQGEDGTVVTTEYHVAAVMGALNETRFRVRAPLVYSFNSAPPDRLYSMMVLTEPGAEQQVAAAATDLWHRTFAEETPHVELLSERFADAQRGNINVGTAAVTVAGLCALLCFAGLYGMASHWVATRRRELALRRVLGAGGRQITRLFLRKMLTPILAGGLLALVPAWLLMQEWLATTGRDRAELPYGLYGAVLAAVLLLATLILIGHIRRVLAIRPAAVLHHE